MRQIATFYDRVDYFHQWIKTIGVDYLPGDPAETWIVQKKRSARAGEHR